MEDVTQGLKYVLIDNIPGLRAVPVASLPLEGLRLRKAPLPIALRPPEPALPRRPLPLLLKAEPRGVRRGPPPPAQEDLPDVKDPP